MQILPPFNPFHVAYEDSWDVILHVKFIKTHSWDVIKGFLLCFFSIFFVNFCLFVCGPWHDHSTTALECHCTGTHQIWNHNEKHTILMRYLSWMSLSMQYVHAQNMIIIILYKISCKNKCNEHHLRRIVSCCCFHFDTITFSLTQSAFN